MKYVTTYLFCPSSSIYLNTATDYTDFTVFLSSLLSPTCPPRFPRLCSFPIFFQSCSPTIHGSIRLEKMNNCQIYLGPCCTSVYIEECSNILIFLACHQLRIHRSHNCICYVRVNSHPIIEDCTGFGFAPYSLSYDTILDDYKVTK